MDDPSRDLPILITKLHAPQMRPNIVARPRLIRLLSSGLRSGHRLALVSAPPGYGKTTLLVEWLAGLEGHWTWLSLDEGDNDPLRFLSHLVAALQLEDGSIGRGIEPWLGRPLLLPLESQMALLINDIAAWGKPLLVVLDEFHVIREKKIQDALAAFLERQPSTVFVVVSTRAEPALPLSLLRTRGQITELTASDLRFTSSEASTFLKQTMGLKLPQKAVAALARRTEGWIAGLQLAGLSLLGKGPTEISEFVHGFSGSHRLVIDFLAEEVLKRQPVHLRRFLLRTSILDRLTAPLCEAVIGEPGGRETLRELEQANLFLLPLDDKREWFRYHTTFAEFLRAQLEPSETQVLHHKAAIWFESKGLLPEAIKHAQASGDHESTARLIAQAAEDVFRHGHLTHLLGWLNGLPEPMVQGNCELATYKGWALSLTQRLQEADRYAAAATHVLTEDAPAPLAGRLFSLKAGLASQRNETEAGIELAHSAIFRLGAGEPFFLSISYSALGNCYETLGDMVSAEPAYFQALRIWQSQGDQVAAMLALFDVVNTLNALGRRREGIELCRQAVRSSSRARDAAPGDALLDTAYLGWSLLAYEANELTFARDAAKRSLVACQKLGIVRGELLAHRLLCRIHVAQGQMDDACESAHIGHLRASEQDLWEAQWFAQAEADLSLQQGDWSAARDWAVAQGYSIDSELKCFHEAGHITYARVLLASGEAHDAARYLRRLQESAVQGGRKRSLITILTLQALAQESMGRQQAAVTELLSALDYAASGDYLRAFLDEGSPAGTLMRGVIGALKDPYKAAFVERLLDAFALPSDSGARPRGGLRGSLPAMLRPMEIPPRESLTPRELELLRLIGDGLSNQAIAERLGVSMSTVKKHINHIMAKLEATDRTQAILRAHQNRLI